MPTIQCPCNCVNSDAELLRHEVKYKTETFVYRCSVCGSLYKLVERENNRRKWLAVGDSDTDFPAEFFTARDAKEFGFQIPCGIHTKQHGYSEALTCDADLLEIVETLSHEAAIGYEETVTIQKCKGCGQLWHCESVYDSHRGTYTKCKKIE